MKPHPLLPGLLALPLLHAAALDLTPRWTDTSIDGIPKRQLYFADGGKKFTVSLDQETEVTPQLGGTSFRFPKLPDIDFIVLPSKFKPSDAFDETKLVQYREAARSLAPAQSRGVETVGEQANPIPINRWQSFRVKLRFTMNSRLYAQEITFLNVSEADQVVLVTSAPERDWSEATERSWQILRSWQEMLPGDEAKSKGN